MSEELGLKDRVINSLEEKRDRILSGKINSIPSPFSRFADDFLGVEQGKYYVVTASTKASKTQFASWLFIYNSIMYAYHHPTQIRIKIFYYAREETPEDVMTRFMSHIIYDYTKHEVRVSPTDMKSVKDNKPVSKDILDLLQDDYLQDIFDFFEKSIIFSQSGNPTGVYNECKRYAEDHGTVHMKEIPVKDDNTGEKKNVKTFDYYEAEDTEEYRIVFFDHVSLVSEERGMNLKQTIDKLSEYCVILRNRYKFTSVLIQQQAFAGESINAQMMEKLKPSVANLADSKYTARDCNLMIGIFSPFKFDIPNYQGYDITTLKDNVRFIEIMINRDGCPGGAIAMYFDGAICYFHEMPKATDTPAMQRIYQYLKKLRES